MSDLFIIGAGASKPYGFPTGLELFESIRDIDYSIDYTKNKEESKYLTEHFKELYKNESNEIDIKKNTMCDFSRDIKNSNMISIDDFLRNRENLISQYRQFEFGKRIIAYKILEAEYKCLTEKNKEGEKCKKDKDNIDWINYLLSYIDRDEKLYKDFFNSKFIIFNYDRLFEQKIFEYLIYDKHLLVGENFGAPIKDASEVLGDMKIIHTHGYIGSLKDVPFGINDVNYGSIYRNIKTASEIENKIKEEIQSHFNECNRIFFIGFGWIEDNMKLLRLDNKAKNILRGKEIHGTAYKISSYNIRNIESRLKLCGALQPNIRDCEAVDLIRDFF
jgi:hypothetical protein